MKFVKSHKSNRKYIVFLLVLIMGGCKPKPIEYITEGTEIADQLNSSRLVIMSEGDEIKMRREYGGELLPSDYASIFGGGLITTLLLQSIEAGYSPPNYVADDISNEAVISYAKNNLENVSLSIKIRENIENQVDRLEWLKINAIEISPLLKKADIVKKLLQDTTQDLLILVFPTFYLSTELDGLMMKVSVDIYPNTEELLKIKNKEWGTRESRISRHTFFYYHEIDKPSTSKKYNASIWFANDARELKVAVQNGVESTTKEVLDALDTPFTVVTPLH